MLYHLPDDVAADAAALRALSRQTEPPYSLSLIAGAAFPGSVITGRGDLPPGIDGIAAVTDDGPLIIYRRELSTGESRLAIAHAIAHLLYDAHAAGELPGRPVDDELEHRADDFAIELLAPAEWLSSRAPIRPDSEGYADQVDSIATDCHVPPSAIDQRIRRLAPRCRIA